VPTSPLPVSVAPTLPLAPSVSALASVAPPPVIAPASLSAPLVEVDPAGVSSHPVGSVKVHASSSTWPKHATGIGEASRVSRASRRGAGGEPRDHSIPAG